jgi:hypothetical protein
MYLTYSLVSAAHCSAQVLLSLKSSSKTSSDPYTVSTEPSSSSMRLRPQRHKHSSQDIESTSQPSKYDDVDALNSGRRGDGDEVMWEVGSVSDGSDDGANDKGEKAGNGVGGIRGGRGERRGLLGDDEDEADDAGGGGSGSSKRADGDGPFGDTQEVDDSFGEYKGVGGDEVDEVKRNTARSR